MSSWLWFTLAHGQTVHVCTNTDTTPPCDATSLAEALAQDPGEIVLRSGTHPTEAVVLSRVGLLIRSADPTSPATLDLTGGDTIFQIEADNVQLQDLWLRPGGSGDGARGVTIGARIRGVVLSGLSIEGGQGTPGAALALERGARAELHGSVLADNEAPLHSGGHVDLANDSWLQIADSTLEGGLGSQGGAISVGEGATLILQRSLLQDNRARIWGGQIVAGTDATITIEDSTLQGGRSRSGGAAIDGYQIRELTLRRSSLHRNATLFLSGGSLFLDGASTVTIEHSTFDPDQLGPAVRMRSIDQATIADSTFQSGLSSQGSAISASAIDDLQLSGSWFCDNLGSAAVDLSGSCSGSCELHENVFQGNRAVRAGGGLRVEASDEVAIHHNTFLSNVSLGNGSAVWLDALDEGDFHHNLVIHNGRRGLAHAAVVLPPGGLDGRYEHNAWHDNAASDVAGGIHGSSDLQLASAPERTEEPDPERPCGEAAWLAWPSTTNEPLFAEGIGAGSGDRDGDGAPDRFDCEAGDPAISPLSEEVPGDGIDQDCDALELCYEDADRDGFGQLEVYTDALSCPGLVALGGDCDDDAPDTHPDAVDHPYDGVDQDCSGADLDDLDGDGARLEDDCDDQDANLIVCDYLRGGSCGSAPLPPGWLLALAGLVGLCVGRVRST